MGEVKYKQVETTYHERILKGCHMASVHGEELRVCAQLREGTGAVRKMYELGEAVCQ